MANEAARPLAEEFDRREAEEAQQVKKRGGAMSEY